MWNRFVNLWTRSFHEWRMTCQSQDQSMPGGGPTIARSNFRKVMSIWYRSPWWIVRCPARNRATGETVASKNRNRSFKRAEWSQRICLWEKNVLEAACRWCVTSNFVRPLFPMQKIHPNHLCPDKLALTCKSFCRRVCKKLGGWCGFFTFVTVCLRSKKQNKQHYNCLALFPPSLVLSLSHKFVKHSLIKQVPLETCHVEICTVSTMY